MWTMFLDSPFTHTMSIIKNTDILDITELLEKCVNVQLKF
uniref:Uncharacterized protein n=1 Tax=viral metagenome TaxID=1070528 RepID=A0A6C0BKX1_9ZZZZ